METLELKKKDYLRFSFIVLLFFMLIAAWLAFGERGFIHLYRMEKDRQAYLDKIHLLEEENRKLLDQIERLRGDKDYIEAVARRELGFVRQNEVIYRFSKDHDSKSQTGAAK